MILLGIIKESNIKFIKQILDEYFGKIHLIYFFIKAQSNLENCIEILKYIKLKNEENFKKGLKKIPLLFIKNGEDLETNNETPPFFKYLIGELKMKFIYELYDNKFNQKKNDEENKINELDDDLFNENEEIENNYDNYCEGNIIQIHIPTGKNINKIFWISKEYLIKNNKFLMDEKDKEFIQMKEYTKKLIKFYIKEKIEKNELNKEEKEEKNTLLERCNNYIDKNGNESSLLNNLETLNIKKGNIFKKGIGYFSSIIFFPAFYIAYFFLPCFAVLGLFKLVDFFFDEFILSLSIKYGFDDKDFIEYDLKKYLITKINEEKKNEKENKNIDDNIKEKTNKEDNDINEKEKLIDKKIYNEEIQKIIKFNEEFFKKLLLDIGPIQCLIKAKELSKELFDLFEELKNRKEKEWITYQIKEFDK